MKLFSATRSQFRHAFTMVEIALAIAVIGFALVAIIGILPTGLQVQKDNREDTIINQDGIYWLEAIRSGATGSLELAQFVEWVQPGQKGDTRPPRKDNPNTYELLGLLCDPNWETNGPRAKVRAISKPAVEKDTNTVPFQYFLTSEIRPFIVNSNVNPNLFEVRLIFRWPWRPVADQPEGATGNGRKVFRTVVSGRLFMTNDRNYDLYFLQSAYSPPPPPP